MHDGKSVNRITIGLFMHDIDDTVGHKRYLGASERARELGVNLFTFIQGLRVDQPESVNICTDYAVSKLDGLICGINPRTCLMSPQDLETYFRNFDLPMVNIANQWDGVPGVMFDDYQGIREVVLHLVQEHGFRRIFFIRGPEDHYYAFERHRSFCDIMMEQGLYDPELISPPADWKPNRFETFKQILGGLQPGRDFDAIVSSNDDWAVEAINRLADWGFGVPEDIAVVGFNDSILGQRIDPPLTSVGPSFYEQGRKAVEILVDSIQGRPTPERLIVPVNLVVRQSCGCLIPAIVCSDLQERNNQDFESAGQTFTETEVIERISNLLITEHNDSVVKYVEPLVRELLSVADGGSTREFLKILNKAIKFSNPDNGIVIWWGIIGNLQQWGSRLLNPSNKELLAQLWKQAQNTLGYKSIISKNNAVSQFREKFWKYHVYLTYLIKIFETQELVTYITQTMPDFGFYSCYLVLYEDQLLYEYPTTPKPIWSRLLLAYTGGQTDVVENRDIVFPANEFLPGHLLDSQQPFNLIVTPIYTRFYQFGYIVCDYRESTPLAYKMVWPQLASCLRGINLLKQRQMAEESLRQQKEELARSNGELQQFANIVSHDLQEPLRKIVAFGERLNNASQGTLNETGRDCLQRIHNATSRMQILINDLLNYSRVTTKAQPFCEVNLNEIIREVLLDLEIKITDNHGKIITADLPCIEADPLQMRQLFQNLIGNALKFFRPNVAPIIQIYTLPSDQGKVQIVVEDNGIGIEDIYFERIFQVFERLHSRSEYEGTGIGLAICKKIVDRHGGNIRIESTVGVGTRFIVYLPLTKTVAKK